MAEIPFLQAHPRNFRKGRDQPIRYLVIHYTANNGDTAAGNARYFSGTVTKTSAHYFVDENQVWQSVLEQDTAYHCGTEHGYRHPFCRNSNSIGIELCSRKDRLGHYYFQPETTERAAQLVRQLAEQYQIPPENILRHYDVTGKNCPAPMVENGRLWDGFKTMIWEDDFMSNYPDWAKKTYHWIHEMPEWAREAAQKAVKQGIVATNPDNSVTLLGVNLQTLVYLDRAGFFDGGGGPPPPEC